MNKQPPSMPSWWVIAFPTFLLGWAGSKISGEAFSLTNPGTGEISGAAVGMLIGTAVYVDDKLVQRRNREDPPHQSSDGASSISSSARSRSDVIAVLMLIIPVVAALLMWQRQRFGLSPQASTAIGFLAITSTAVLGYVDARQLRRLASTSATGESRQLPPTMSFAAMIAMWVFCFPLYFVGRRSISSTNFIIPAVLVTVLFMGSCLAAFFARAELPAVDAPEVVSLVVRAVEKSPEVIARQNDIGTIRINDPVEVSYDQKKQRRVARAKLISNAVTEFIFYSVEWHDAKKGVFSVQITEQP